MDSKDERDYLMKTIVSLCTIQSLPNTSNQFNTLKMTDWSTVDEIRWNGFKALSVIGDLYYEYLNPYIKGICDLSLTVIKNRFEPKSEQQFPLDYPRNNEDVIKSVLDFWVTIGDREEKLLEKEAAEEEEEAEAEMSLRASGIQGGGSGGQGGDNDIRCLNILSNACEYFAPHILLLLFDINEDTYEPTEWSVVTGAEKVLDLIATADPDKCYILFKQFITQAQKMGTWQSCNAIFSAFGCLCSGEHITHANDISNDVNNIIPLMSQTWVQTPPSSAPSGAGGAPVPASSDAQEVLRITILNSLSKIFQGATMSAAAHMREVIDILMDALKQNSSDLVKYACITVSNIALIQVELTQEEEEDDEVDGTNGDQSSGFSKIDAMSMQQSNFISPLIKDLFQLVMQRALSSNAFDKSTTTEAWSALNLMVQCTAQDALPSVGSMSLELIRNAENLVKQRIASYGPSAQQGFSVEALAQPDQSTDAVQLKEQLVYAQNAVTKFGKINATVIRDAYHLAIDSVSVHSADIVEEALTLLSVLSSEQGSNFNVCLDQTIPIIRTCMSLTQYPVLAEISCHIVGSIIRSNESNPSALDPQKSVLQDIVQKAMMAVGIASKSIPIITYYNDPQGGGQVIHTDGSGGFQPPPDWIMLPVISAYVSILFDYISVFSSQSVSLLALLSPQLGRLSCICAWKNPTCSQENVDELRSTALETLSMCLESICPGKEIGGVKIRGDMNITLSDGSKSTVEMLLKTIGIYATRALDGLIKLYTNSSKNTSIPSASSLNPSTSAPSTSPLDVLMSLPANEVCDETLTAMLNLIFDIGKCLGDLSKDYLSNASIVNFVKTFLKSEVSELRDAAYSACVVIPALAHRKKSKKKSSNT